MAERALSDILDETFVRCRDLEVPLADRLQVFATEVRRMGPHFAVAVDNLVQRLFARNFKLGNDEHRKARLNVAFWHLA